MKKSKLANITVSVMLGLGIVSVSEGALNYNSQVVQAATTKKKLTKNAYVYNYKGVKTKAKKLLKGKQVKVYGTKKIKGKKYYRIGKNKYVRTANFAKQAAITLGSITLPNNLDYEFRLADSNGRPINSWLDGNTTWKVLATKNINGKKYYKIADGWLNSDYLNVKASSAQADSSETSTDKVANTTQSQKSSVATSSSSSSQSTSETTSSTDSSSVKLTPELVRQTEKEFIKLVNDWRAKQGLSSVTSNPAAIDYANERAKHNAAAWDTNKNIGDNHEGASGLYGELEYIVPFNTPADMAKQAFEKFVYDDASANWAHRASLQEKELSTLTIGLASTTNNNYYSNGVAFNVEY